jgi:hypothetical protein
MRKRQYKRFIVDGMNIYAKMIFSSEIEILDISTGGARIKSTENLKLGSSILIIFENKKIQFPIMCTVIWEKLSGSINNAYGEFVPVYESGIKFKDIYSDKLVRLKDFIRLSGIAYEDSLINEYGPSALRFKIKTNEKALINYPKTSTVKKLSFGGMLVGTNYDIQVERRYTMGIFLPNEFLPIKFPGRIASRIDLPESESQRFDVGIEFLNMAARDKTKLSKFLQLIKRI